MKERNLGLISRYFGYFHNSISIFIRWLQLEVCREYQRQKCSRTDGDCKFAHPPDNIEVQSGRVTACYDSIKVGQK